MWPDTSDQLLQVRAGLLENVVLVVDQPNKIVTMKMPGRDDYGCYLELDGGYPSWDEAADIATLLRDRLADVRDETIGLLREAGD